MSHHSVVDRQHQASVELLVLSHIGRRKRSVKLKKKPPDLQPVVPLELGCMYALCNRHPRMHSHSWPPTARVTQQVFGIPRIWEGGRVVGLWL